MADGEGIFIREVQGADRMEVLLGGSALPERGLEIETEQRLVQTHYPGAAVAHTQVLGAKHRPLVLLGKLRDTWLGARGAAQVARTRLELLTRRGRLCEASWGETIVVRGYLQRARFRVIADGQLDYELSFQVDATDEPRAMAPEPYEVTEDDLRQHMTALQAFGKALDAVLAINNVIRAVL